MQTTYFSSEQHSDYSRLDTQAKKASYGLPSAIFVGERGAAYETITNLEREGYFSGKPNEKAFLDIKSEKHARALVVAERFYNIEDDLKDLSYHDRNFCNLLYNRMREEELKRAVFNTSPDKDKAEFHKDTVISVTKNLFTKCVGTVTQVLTFGEVTGLIVTDNKPMDLAMFKRIYPKEILDERRTTELLETSLTPLHEEVKIYLNSLFSIKTQKNNAPPSHTPPPVASEPITLKDRGHFTEINPQKDSQNTSFFETVETVYKESLEELKQLEKNMDETLTPEALQKVEQLLEKADKIAAEFEKKCQDKEGEFWKQGAECVQKIAKAIHSNISQGRADRAQHFQYEEMLQTFQNTRSLRQGSGAPDKITYSEVELFVKTNYRPNDLLNTSIIDLKRRSEAYSKIRNELRKRSDWHEKSYSSCHNLSLNIDRRDNEAIRQNKKKVNQQRHVAQVFRHLTTMLEVGASVLAFATPGANLAYVAALLASGEISRIGQGIVGKRIDQTENAMRRRLNKSSHTQNVLSQTSATHQNALYSIDGQLLELKSVFFNNSLDAKGTRDGLSEAYKDSAREIAKLEKLKTKQEDEYKSAKKACLDATFAVHPPRRDKEKAEKKLKKNTFQVFGKSPQEIYNEAKKKYDEAVDDLDKKESAQLEASLKLKTTSEKIHALKSENKTTEKQLEYERFIAPMKDQMEEVILHEQEHWEFDRYKENDKDKGVEAGDLTDTGKAQQELRTGFANYDQARSQERQFVKGGVNALRGISTEASRYTNSHKPATTIDLLEQIYHLHDRYKHFRDAAIPQYKNFMTVLNSGEKPLLEQLQQFNAVEAITNFLIPGMQIVSAVMAVKRLASALMTKENHGLSPEQQFWIDMLQNGFKQQQKIFSAELSNIQHILERNADIQSEEMKEIRNDIANAVKIVSDKIDRAEAKILKSDQFHFWKQFEYNIDDMAAKLDTKDKVFHIGSTSTPAELKDKTDKYLKYLLKMAFAINKPHINGLKATTDNGKKVRFDASLISRHPAYFAGLFAAHLGDATPDSPVPNFLLFHSLRQAVNRLKTSVYNNSHLDAAAFEVSFKELEKELGLQLQSILKLKSSMPSFLNAAVNAKKHIESLVRKNITDLQSLREQFQKEAVFRHLKDTLKLHEDLKGPLFVGSDKYLIANIINSTPLIPKEEKLQIDLNGMDNGLCLQIMRKKTIEASLGFGAMGAVAGMLGGPATAAMGALAFTGGVFSASTVGCALDVIVNKTGELFCKSEMWWPDFYHRVEVKILDKMQTPLKDFDIQAALTREPAFIKKLSDYKTGIIGTLTFSIAFCNRDKRLKIEKFSYWDNKFKDEKREYFFDDFNYSKKDQEYAIEKVKFENKKSLLKLNIHHSLRILDYKIEFSPESLIQEKDFMNIKALNNPADKHSELLLLTAYLSWLKATKESVEANALPSENLFTPLATRGELIPSLGKNLLPLLLPLHLLKNLEQQLLADALELMSSRTGVLVPFFDFQLTHHGEYELSLHYRLMRYEGGIEEFCSFTLATFDKPAVEAFKKWNFTEEDGKHIYSVGASNPQEFLLQAMYAGVFNATLPGEGTLCLQEERQELYIPNPQPFHGLFALWEKRPYSTITYHTHLYSSKEELSVYGPRLQPHYNRNYLKIWHSIQTNNSNNEEFNKAVSDYEESYHMLMGMYQLITGRDFDTCKKQLKEDHRLFSPEKSQQLYSDIYLSNT